MPEKVAVVTGANKGLGYAVVKGLCHNFKGVVYLTSRNEQRGLKAVKHLHDAGLHPEYHILDIESDSSVKTFANFIESKHGGLDVLVNNAAVMDYGNVYPSYEEAKKNIDVNYKSLLRIEKYLFPLLRASARVVNVSSACGHLSNLRNPAWVERLKNPDLTEEQLTAFVDEYLESVRNQSFDKQNFADEGKHAEHRISKVAVTALTMLQQRKYARRNISVNAVHPGYMRTDMARGAGEKHPDEAAKVVLYLILEASQNLKGVFMWHDRKLIDWYDRDGDMYYVHKD